jgi:alcohol dehydrogenase YqhD (iron-dependent ADH family)
MIGQAVGAYTDATHGMTLSAVSPAYYSFIMPYAIEKFKRFAVNVWGVDAEHKADDEVAALGLQAMEKWMEEIGVIMNLTELGVTDDMFEGIADGTFIMQGGYKILTRSDVIQILKESM